MSTYRDEDRKFYAMVLLGISLVIGLVVTVAMLWPVYNVYKSKMAGKALLVEAEYSKQIAIEEAVAKRKASKELAEAEVIRAGGVAKANVIIGSSLKDNESYLRYLWVQGLNDGHSEVIYVPTEANMPILEAGRFGERSTKKD